MKKKLLSTIGAIAALAAPLAAVVSCGSKDDVNAASDSKSIKSDSKAMALKEAGDLKGYSKDTIRIIGHKREVIKQSQAAVKSFNEAFGTNLVIEQIGGATDYGSYLTTKFSNGSGDTGLVGLEQIGDEQVIDKYVVDTKATDVLGDSSIDDKGELVVNGKHLMSAASEALGVVYNKDVFKKAGINVKIETDIPASNTDKDGFDNATGDLYASHLTKDGYEQLTKALHDKNITPFYSTYGVNGNDVWPITNHLLSSALKVNGIDDSNVSSKTGAEVFTPDVVTGIDQALKLYKSNGGEATSTSSVDEAMAKLATGQVAMVQNGQWAFDQIANTVKDAKVGFLPMPVYKNDTAQFMKGTTQKWAMTTKDEAKQKTIKLFLRWLYTTNSGVTALEANFGSIQPYATSAKADQSKITNTLIASSSEYSSNVVGGALALGNLPDGFNNSLEGFRKLFNDGSFTTADGTAAANLFDTQKAAKTSK